MITPTLTAFVAWTALLLAPGAASSAFGPWDKRQVSAMPRSFATPISYATPLGYATPLSPATPLNSATYLSSTTSLSSAAPPSSATPLSCDQASFAAVLPANATLENVAFVPAGGSYGEGVADIPYPINPTNLPALCAVTVRVTSSPTSSYRFGLFLPNSWNTNFLVVGNGGFAGGINWLDMAAGPHYGMASLSTDTGHSSSSIDGSWALNQPDKKIDWGWRAIHGSTVLGKALVSAYYGNRAIAHSYFSGCSTGGRQGLKEIQLFPDSFDGLLIGAPAWWTTHLLPWMIQVFIYNQPINGANHLSLADIAVLAAEVVRQCDPIDGVIDGIVSKPERCNLDFNPLLCPADGSNFLNLNSTACLTAAQINTARNVYSNWVSSNGTFLHPGLELSSEAQWWILLNGTQPSPYGLDYVRYFLFNDPAWDWRTFNESVVFYADATDPGNATAADYGALAAFRRRGGKAILYHGYSDGLVPTKDSELYYNRTVATVGDGGDIRDFMRMFLIPGMAHCFGTAVNAPWAIGGEFQAALMGSSLWSVPGFMDPQHDAVLALVDWVERGIAVDSIIATTWQSPMNPMSGVLRQRPICPWPQSAVYNGVGDVNSASSWYCSTGN